MLGNKHATFVKEVYDEKTTLGSLERSLDIAQACAESPEGYFAEFGTFQGGISVILVYFAIEQGKHVHLFDVFTGLPDWGPEDEGIVEKLFPVGGMKTSVASLERQICKRFGRPAFEKHVTIHDGLFTHSSEIPLGPCAFAHIDFDLYDGIYQATAKVFNQLHKHGKIAVHDYANTNLPGVKRAVDELMTSWADLATGQYKNECFWLSKRHDSE
jgi:hypothetical protein